MLVIQTDILAQYEAVLVKRSVPTSRHSDYKKWLRYYLDFCGKYSVPDAKSDRVRLFIEKLKEKKQPLEKQKQAAHSVSLYFETQKPSQRPNRSLLSDSSSVVESRSYPAMNKKSSR